MLQVVTLTNSKPVLSTFRSPGGPQMRPIGGLKVKRFDDSFTRNAAQIPGPGQYSPVTDGTDAQGTYFVDRYKNSKAPVFNK